MFVYHKTKRKKVHFCSKNSKGAQPISLDKARWNPVAVNEEKQAGVGVVRSIEMSRNVKWNVASLIYLVSVSLFPAKGKRGRNLKEIEYNKEEKGNTVKLRSRITREWGGRPKLQPISTFLCGGPGPPSFLLFHSFIISLFHHSFLSGGARVASYKIVFSNLCFFSQFSLFHSCWLSLTPSLIRVDYLWPFLPFRSSFLSLTLLFFFLSLFSSISLAPWLFPSFLNLDFSLSVNCLHTSFFVYVSLKI